MLKKLLINLSATILFLSCLLCFNGALGQTVTITGANSTGANGITAGSLADGQTDIVLFGFKVTVSGPSSTINQFNLTGTQGGLFTNGKLYRTAAGGSNFSGATLVAGANVAFSGSNPVITNISETITNTNYTYFLVADLSKSYGTIPGNLQIGFSQAIQPTPYVAYSASFTGVNFSLVNPTYTLTSANAAGNGITQGNIIPNQTNVVLFGFGVSSNTNTTASTININSTSTQNFLSYYLGNGKLYRSTSSTFSFGTATQVSGATVAFSNYQHAPGITISGISESITSTTVYYFVIGDFNQNTGVLPSTIQFKFQTSQTNAFILSNSANIVASSNINGTSFTFSNPTYTLTSANAAINGITQGTLRPAQPGIVLFGFGVSVNSNTTVSGFNLYNTYNQGVAQAYFNNGKLYRSSSNTFSIGTATLVSSATVAFGYDAASGIQISGLSESISSTTTYYFVVGDFIATSSATLPATSQFMFLTSQSNPIVQSGPTSSNITVASNINGTNFSLDKASLTVTGYNSLSNGITGGALNYGQTDIVLFGFNATVVGKTTIGQIDIPSSINANGYFNNGRLYRSSSSTFSFGTATLISGAAITFPGTYAHVDGLSEVLDSFAGTSNYYYFLVADFLASTSFSSGTLQYNFASGTTSFIQTVSPYTTFNTANTTNGYSYIVGSIYDWVGTTSTSFSTASNFRINGSIPGVAPSTNDLVRIGVLAYQSPFNQPTVGANTTIAKLWFGANNTPTLLLGSNKTLTVTNGVILENSTTAVITGGGSTTSFTLSSSAISKIPAGSSLTVDNKADFVNAGTFNNAGSFTVDDNSSNSGTFNQTGSGVSTFTKLFNNTGTFNSASSGSTTFTGVLTNSSTGTIQNSIGTINITANFSNAGTLTGSSGTYNFNGAATFANTGTVAFTGGTANFVAVAISNTNPGTFTASGGTINLNFAGAQTFNNSNGTTPVTFNNLILSGGAFTKTLAATNSAKYNINSTGSLEFTSTNTVLAAGTALLTLKSNASGSATVKALLAGNSVTGTVNVERYITGGASTSRGYRLISSPVSISAASLIYPNLTYISARTYTTGTGGSGNGFDATGNPTLYLYRESLAPNSSSFISGNFRGVSKINTTSTFSIDTDGSPFNIPAGNGVLLFFRGDRATTVNPTVTTTIATTSTFTALGYLNQGDITVKHWHTGLSTLLYTSATANTAVRGFNLVGNPYASSIDWDKKLTTGITSTSIGNTIWIYNPTTRTYATYVAGSGGVGTNGNDANIIPSGQGFFVRASATNAALTFTEAAKSTAQGSSSLLMSTDAIAGDPVLQYIRVQLAKDSVNTDQSLVFFKKGANSGFTIDEDAEYLNGNSTLNLSSRTTDNAALAINTLPFQKTTQTIPLNVAITSDGPYQLKMAEMKNIPKMYDVWLMDAYKKDSLDIKNNATYNFNASTADAATYGANRFTLVVRPNVAYSYHLLDFAATKQTNTVQLTWKTENEESSTFFTIERSIDGGKSFNVIGSAVSKSLATYGIQDNAPATGENQYRLKQEDFFGTITYSKIIPIMYSPKTNVISYVDVAVYPNPASTTLNLVINKPVNTQASYNITITNNIGLKIKTATTSKTEWSSYIGNLSPGNYFIQVINTNDNTVVGSNKFIKL